MKPRAITVGVQVGGPTADEATNEALLALRKAIANFCKGPYSPDVDEFALLFRIPGEVGGWGWFIDGCSRLRRGRKERYISIDIGVARDHWENRAPHELRQYLAMVVREAFILMIERLKKDKTPVNGVSLLNDYAKAVNSYLA